MHGPLCEVSGFFDREHSLRGEPRGPEVDLWQKIPVSLELDSGGVLESGRVSTSLGRATTRRKKKR